MALTRSPSELAGLRERVRAFIEERVIPAEDLRHAHDHRAFTAAIAPLREEARSRGLFGPQLSTDLGGLGLCWEECCDIFEEAGRSFLGPGALHCGAPTQPDIAVLEQLASPYQREHYLLPLARAEMRSAFAMTEPMPGAGSDPRMLCTTARKVSDQRGEGWVIDGRKWFASGVTNENCLFVVARAERGPSWFIVDPGTPGLEIVREIPTMDPFGTGAHVELRFTDCRVGAEALVGEEGKGLDYAQMRLEGARLFHCMRFIGLASRALEIAQDYAAKRESFGAKLAEHQMVQAMVADSHIDLYAARLMTRDVARRLDSGASIRHESSMAKVFVAEAVNRVADCAIQMTGALGTSGDVPLSLIAAQMRPFRIFDGASEVHRAAIARRAFNRRLRG
jgi:acyl-CoA dehydrogenase